MLHSCWSSSIAKSELSAANGMWARPTSRFVGGGYTCDSSGYTVEFWFSERRNLTAAKCFLHKALKRHGWPERIVIDGSQTNRETILACDAESRLQDGSRRKLEPIRIQQSAYLNNRIVQDHRAIKCRVRSMLGFKSMASARAILGGIEMIHMMRKGQAKYACRSQVSLAEQFHLLAA
jgi:putative transposase